MRTTYYNITFYDENDDWQDGECDLPTKAAAIKRADEYLRHHLTSTARIIRCVEILEVSIPQPVLKVEKLK